MIPQFREHVIDVSDAKDRYLPWCVPQVVVLPHVNVLAWQAET